MFLRKKMVQADLVNVLCSYMILTVSSHHFGCYDRLTSKPGSERKKKTPGILTWTNLSNARLLRDAENSQSHPFTQTRLPGDPTI